MTDIFVDIERIILTDFDLAPGRVEHVKGLVEMQLHQIFEREGIPNGITGIEISNLSGPVMNLSKNNSDTQIAHNLARSISQSIRSSV